MVSGECPPEATQRSFDQEYFAPLFAIEDRHFWFRTRNRVIETVVRQITADLAPGYRALEVGCGTGNVLRVLERACRDGTVIGLDLFAEGLDYARKRTACALIQGDIHSPPFREPFDIIGLFDVLEHLPDDKQVLLDLHSILAEGGALLLTVPAHQSLWSYFDEGSHHYRRYALLELESKLINARYTVEYLTQYMAGIFPFLWLGRRLKSRGLKRRSGDASCRHDPALDELRVVPIVNGVLAGLLAPEASLIARRHKLPIGASLLAVARKGSTTRR